MGIGRFEDIQAWQAAWELCKEVYQLTGDEKFHRDFGLRDQARRAAVSVMANIAEGFDSHSKLITNPKHRIPNLELRTSNVEPPTLTVWGTGKATREFLYVEDAAEAIVLAAERYNKPGPINIGVGFEISIRDLVWYRIMMVGWGL